MNEIAVPNDDTLFSNETEYLWKVHAYLSEMSKFADAKIGASIVFSSSLLGYLVSQNVMASIRAFAAAVQSADASVADFLVSQAAVGTAAAAVLALSVGSSLWGFHPRFWPFSRTRPGGPGSIFWNAILLHRDAADYLQRVRAMSVRDRAHDVASQIYSLAEVVRMKFDCLRTAMWFLFVGTVLTVAFRLLWPNRRGGLSKKIAPMPALTIQEWRDEIYIR